MARLFQVNENLMYNDEPGVERNGFFKKKTNDDPLPGYDESKKILPQPFWKGHESVIECHDFAWKTAFQNLRKANADAGFVSDFIDTAFNGYLFMWDSAFIVLFGKYGSRAFDFHGTLDNFYSHQHRDGFISREIYESQPGERFSRDDPASTGPNVLPFAEWEHYLSTGDLKRISEVFDPLCAYHKWLQLNRSWQDGSYWSCGLACGMDNQPRQGPGYHALLSHGFMSWVDTCAQQYLSADILCKMGKVLGREEETEWLKKEKELLFQTINDKMWSEEDSFYYDVRRDGTRSGVKTVGAYWTLLSGLVPEKRIPGFVAHLDNEKEFKRPNRIPALSADDPSYDPYGGYWKGGVWAPTNYMVLSALHKYNYERLAFEIASDYLSNVTKVFEEFGTVFENYSPEYAAPGRPSRKDFVGWTGLAPISILYEYVFGIHPDAANHTITWNVFLTEEHGIRNYPFGDATVELTCKARSSEDSEPDVTVKCSKPITVVVHWKNKSKIVTASC